MNWYQLQNGSDIRGVALEGIEGEAVNLNEPVAERLGAAFAQWLLTNGDVQKRVAVAMDSRITGPKLKSAFIKGVCSCGLDVLDCGLASTPAMFMCCIDPDLEVAGAVMLTASHLPFNRNGMKFFTGEGGFDKQQIGELLQLAADPSFSARGPEGKVEEYDLISAYASRLVGYIRKAVNADEHDEHPLAGMKIVVDAGNGAGGFFASRVLDPLGADTRGSQFLEPDGLFPNHVPNPEDEKAMQAVSEAVQREKADLGVIFDTDVDRAALVDRHGRPINRNDLIALISTIVLREHPGSGIVTDSITSTGLKQFIEGRLGGRHHRFRRGYKNVINEAKRLNAQGDECWLAIETSGHAALRENHFLDDGAFLIAKLLVEAARLNQTKKDLGSLIAELVRPLETKEFRLKIAARDFREAGELVLAQLEELVLHERQWQLEKPNYEGIRVNCMAENEQGWFLLRLSLHDPLMPLNIESDIRGGVSAIAGRLKSLLVAFPELDSSSIKPSLFFGGSSRPPSYR